VTAPKHPKHGPAYWDRRFADGIGAGRGSEGEAALAKARYVNELIASEPVETVADWGCGDGGFLGMIRAPHYVGIDVAPSAIAKAVVTHGHSRSFVLWRPGAPIEVHADLALSLDVVFHLVDDVEYRQHLAAVFGSADRLVAFHATNRPNPEGAAPHMRHRVWIEDVPSGWELVAQPDDGMSLGWYLFRRTP